MKICVVGTRGFPETQGGVEKHCEILYTTMGKQCPVEIFEMCIRDRYYL